MMTSEGMALDSPVVQVADVGPHLLATGGDHRNIGERLGPPRTVSSPLEQSGPTRTPGGYSELKLSTCHRA